MEDDRYKLGEMSQPILIFWIKNKPIHRKLPEKTVSHILHMKTPCIRIDWKKVIETGPKILQELSSSETFYNFRS